MGRVEIGTSPGRLAPVHVLAADEALSGTDPLKGVEPVLVIRVTQVRVALFLGRLDFLAEDFNPLRPGEPAGFRQAHGQGEGLCFPRLIEDRTVLVPGQCREIVDGLAGIIHRADST